MFVIAQFKLKIEEPPQFIMKFKALNREIK